MSSREQGVKPEAQRAIGQQSPRNDSSTADDDYVPSCWICLEEGPDESGKGLVRDCSCRGNSGFAHLGCLIEYAKRTSMDMAVDQLVVSDGLTDDKVRKFTVHWEKCSICHQRYQRELAIDLANSLLLFIDEKKPENNFIDQMRHMHALTIKIDMLIRAVSYNYNSVIRLEGKQTAFKLLAMAQQMKSRRYEAVALEGIGHFEGFTKENYKVGIKHYRKAIKIYESVGETRAAKNVRDALARIKSKYDATEAEPPDEVRLKNAKEVHEEYIQAKGEHSMNTIKVGLNLAVTLSHFGHCIESERLLIKQMKLSLQIHGQEHDLTKLIKSCSEIFKQRKVTIPSQPGVEFEALRYEADGDKYAVRRASHRVINKSGGASPGSTKGEIFTVASKDVLWREGTPVICHGLKKASHLNGKIGDARSFNDSTGRYGVHFEHAGEPVAVKKENLRIVFEFPY